MLETLYKKLFGDHNAKHLKTLEPLVEKINIQEEIYQELSEEEFLENTEKFKDRIEAGETTDDLLIEAFATVKNACRRLTDKKYQFQIGKNEMTWAMIPYDVQLLGGIVLHKGNIAEMKTGEGKTLVSTLPIYLNALAGKGVHVVTVNEYLAERDAEWNGQLFNYLGLSVSVIKHGQNPETKREAYAADITYATNNELGFDYLRDNMAVKTENQVMRDQYFAVIDEVDSILIDEARTPLIISAAAEESTEKYQEYARLTQQLQAGVHYKIEEKEKAATLTEAGIAKMEQLLGIENIYTDRGVQEVHHIEASLKARAIFKRDFDYVIQDGQIVIVDEFTGRLMPGRRYSGGLHQAIEAKEGVEVKRESTTLASITFQNYFRLYSKLSGMTGTALTEAKEFGEIYGLDTYSIPTHRPIARIDKPDAVFKNTQGKYTAIVKRVKEAYEKKQPVLIGTISIERSEMLSDALKKAGIVHKVLNAKHHEQEAEIIANAGKGGVITIATNMAGRGTDIKPDATAYAAGGLLVIGTERHESRRIDNQLRGRSGRQGDVGETQFFVSMDDDLLRLFGSERMKNMMDAMGLPDDMPIENAMISNAIESAQKKVETRNFEIRKHVLEYDNVMNKHRTMMYALRKKVLQSENLRDDILALVDKHFAQIVESHTTGIKPVYWNFEEIHKALSQAGQFHLPSPKELQEKADESVHKLEDLVIKTWKASYIIKEKNLEVPVEALRQTEKAIYLRNIDRLWMDHIDEMTKLRETVSLRAYANKNPLFEYKHEAFESFKILHYTLAMNTLRELTMVEITAQPLTVQRVAPDVSKLQTNDDQIEKALNHEKPTIGSAAPFAKPQSVPVSAPVQAKPSVRQEGEVTVYRADDEVTYAAPDMEKVGRNDPCPCGSGKKFKKCCG